MDIKDVTDSLFGNSPYDVHNLSGDILKVYNREYEVYLKKKTILFIIDKRNMLMKKVYRDVKLGYEAIMMSQSRHLALA